MLSQISLTARRIGMGVVATAKARSISIDACECVLEDCLAMLSAPDTTFPRSGRFVVDEFRAVTGFMEALVRLLTRAAAQVGGFECLKTARVVALTLPCHAIPYHAGSRHCAHWR